MKAVFTNGVNENRLSTCDKEIIIKETTDQANETDVLIVGSGPAGSTAALALST